MPGASGVINNRVTEAAKAKQGQMSQNPASRAPAQRIPPGGPPKAGGDGDVLTEYERMIFAQEFEEDDSERLAQQLQSEMYGGGAAGGGGGGMNDMMGGGDAAAQVRQADSGHVEQMVGGPEPSAIYQNMRR